MREWVQFVAPPRRAPARGLPGRLRHAARRAAGAGRGRVDQHPAASLGGLRHQRHEGARQRGIEPLRTRRLVGRGVPPEVGWALGDGREHGDDPDWDATRPSNCWSCSSGRSCRSFIDRDERGIPRAWVANMRESMATLTPAYSANRRVREYMEHCYLPAAASYRARADQQGRRMGNRQLAGSAGLRNWPTLRFGAVSVQTQSRGTPSSESGCTWVTLQPEGHRRPNCTPGCAW